MLDGILWHIVHLQSKPGEEPMADHMINTGCDISYSFHPTSKALDNFTIALPGFHLKLKEAVSSSKDLD